MRKTHLASHGSDNFNVPTEQTFPESYLVSFLEGNSNTKPIVEIFIRNTKVGDTLSDNSYEDDCYRYHDVFHFSFATILGWSPCVRKLCNIKRKYNKLTDEVEDGARALIIEEAISLLVFKEAKKKAFFQHGEQVSQQTLAYIQDITSDLEVSRCNTEMWQGAIQEAYKVFCMLKQHRGGLVHFDIKNKSIHFKPYKKDTQLSWIDASAPHLQIQPSPTSIEKTQPKYKSNDNCYSKPCQLELSL
jgi:hypothetical protein